MIGYLSGTILTKTDKTLILEIGGVGYSIYTSSALLRETMVGSKVAFYIHTHVREDALELYGLPTLDELEFFKKLIGISGVGPKSALGIFEVAPLNEIKQAIAKGDPTLLMKVSGIGKKTAELIVVKLKDKHAALLTEGEKSGAHGEALEALTGLGYNLGDARTVLSKLPAKLTTTEEKVKAALKLLGRS